MRCVCRLALFASCSLVWTSIAPPAAFSAPAEHVVVISLDGMPGYMLDDTKALLPNIRRLAQEGVAAPPG